MRSKARFPRSWSLAHHRALFGTPGAFYLDRTADGREEFVIDVPPRYRRACVAAVRFALDKLATATPADLERWVSHPRKVARADDGTNGGTR